jgi:hypothetical protein
MGNAVSTKESDPFQLSNGSSVPRLTNSNGLTRSSDDPLRETSYFCWQGKLSAMGENLWSSQFASGWTISSPQLPSRNPMSPSSGTKRLSRLPDFFTGELGLSRIARLTCDLKQRHLDFHAARNLHLHCIACHSQLKLALRPKRDQNSLKWIGRQCSLPERSGYDEGLSGYRKLELDISNSKHCSLNVFSTECKGRLFNQIGSSYFKERTGCGTAGVSGIQAGHEAWIPATLLSNHFE